MDLTGLSDHLFAAELARRTGQRLQRFRAEHTGLSGRELGRAGDAAGQAFIAEQLARYRPGDGVLSEEAPDDAARLGQRRVWIVDPLDGTKEYGLGDRPDWAVHIALWADGITAAAVAVPELSFVYSTADPVPASPPEPKLLVSATRPPDAAVTVAAELGLTLTGMGSAGAKTAAVIRGEAVGYLHAGGQWEWDSAAPVGVALAAGLHASRADGSPLAYNRPNPYLPDLLICHPAHASAITELVAGA
ncbi:3'(2'),5'-bisphosphate nucleotidase CysQ [Actinokineospora enzanensis]|uniref:3'(2'),5'-bisphosphate nucleotidase CysQ n=1 Tax=Actinokineospora enzanensis TaxID=155975 RepID=UPI000368EAE9|nr:3'(2'),5'-bisphosphate nucleotidase CysQ [Actinokineospora enzanensis]